MSPKKNFKWNLWFFAVMLVLSSWDASAQNKKPKNSVKPKKKLETSLKLSEQIISGKFQTPGEGTVVVEDEKAVFNLLSVRANFNDRRKKERQRDGGQNE